MRRTIALIAVMLLAAANSVTGSDWPMWRHDAARSGSTPDELPERLHLQWTLELPPPKPAWPASQTKLGFDVGYEPVVAGRRMVIASTVNESVCAVDTRTAELDWVFFTNGPVRFAPAIEGGRVYAVSDDGYLYCLDLETGKQRWKVRGGPRQRQIIGNDRLISTWSARGGVVVRDGVAYFSAGIWPMMGVFVQAVDAESGKLLWNNSTTGSRFITHPHNADSFGSISPQGYLALSGEDLIVPGGRTLPGVFDVRTGELRHFEFGGKGEGGYDAFASGDFLHVRDIALRVSNGASIGKIPARVVGSRGIVGSVGATFVVTSTTGKTEEKTVKDRRGRKRKIVAFKPKRTERFPVEGPSRVFMQAGRRVFAADSGRIAAYQLPDEQQPLQPAWSHAIEGEVWSMLAADDRLFVVTTNGRVHCFGAEAVAEIRVIRTQLPSRQPDDSAATPGNAARGKGLLEVSGQRDGYALSIGNPLDPTVRWLLEESQLRLIAVDSDTADVDRRRRIAWSDERYGERITFRTGDFLDEGLPPYFASLVFCDRDRRYSKEEIATAFGILRPYGGACCLYCSADEHSRIARVVETGSFPNAEVERKGGWTVVRRAGPLPGAGVWTHHYGDASNALMSRDTRVKAPFGLLWFGGPPNDRVLPRHGHGPAPQVAGGRLFIEGPDMLRSVDVYTGRVWWERDLPGLGTFHDNTSHHPGAGEVGGNYVSVEDHVYVVLGEQLLELDAETGKTVRQFHRNAKNGEPTTWGTILLEGDTLIATAAPVTVSAAAVSTGEQRSTVSVPANHRAIVPPNAEWRYLAGRDPADGWARPDFDASGWKTGRAGFGYGDGDDRTVLSDMKDKYGRVYIRTEFDARNTGDAASLKLAVNYDDGFIAYLNGREVARSNVKSGRGKDADDVASHEAGKSEVFPLRDAAKWMTPGRNVLAIEGHNRSLGSSDFTLDPCLVVAGKPNRSESVPNQPPSPFAAALKETRYSSASRILVAFDRRAGKPLWSRKAQFNFRHNAICTAGGRVFCIDGMSPAKLSHLKKRGIVPRGKPRLLALDARTGRELWSTGEQVFGTFLSYSREHDILLQGGSAYRDRAKDEVGTGLIAYRGKSGEVVWKDLSLEYGGPCILWHDRIITNGGGGFAIELLTGKRLDWTYSRNYGCNTAIGSEHLLTFRSGAAGFYDLLGDSGTGNLGGFRTGCTSNLVAADGVLNAPDYTRTCVCAYQLQTSLAMIHDPDAEVWTFGRTDYTNRPVAGLGVNLGAPGDRRDDDGVLWFDHPSVGGPSPNLKIETEPASPATFARHTSLMARDRLNWVGASGLHGVRKIRLQVALQDNVKQVSVRLVFAEPDGLKPGERVFSVSINGRTVLEKLDIAASQQGASRTLVRDFQAVPFSGDLTVTLDPIAGFAEPVLCGVAVFASDSHARRRRSR